ncbi:MAG: hypothetical protein ACRD9S_07905 [Pyrinomonadaceae bacterium]
MGSRMQLKPLLLLVVTLAFLLLFSTTALGQCSMCRSALAGSSNAFFVRNFNIGVLVLLIPPVTIFCSIFVALKRHKTADDENQGDEKS